MPWRSPSRLRSEPGAAARQAPFAGGRLLTVMMLRGYYRPSPAVGDPVRISLVGLLWMTGLRRPTRTPRWLNPAIRRRSSVKSLGPVKTDSSRSTLRYRTAALATSGPSERSQGASSYSCPQPASCETGYQPWVKVQSAGLVKVRSARTPNRSVASQLFATSPIG